MIWSADIAIVKRMGSSFSVLRVLQEYVGFEFVFVFMKVCDK